MSVHEDLSAFGSIVGLIVGANMQNSAPFGSAVMVAAGVAITATHALESILNEIKNSSSPQIVTAQFKTKAGLQIWSIQSYTKSDDNDLAIICMDFIGELGRSIVVPTAHINLSLPRIGQQVLLCGFSASSYSVDATKKEISNTVFPLSSIGVVEEVFPIGRGRVFPGLQFQCSAVAMGGMSGGPVFDPEGKLIGITMSCMEPDTPNGKSTTFVSSIIPAALTVIQGVWPPAYYKSAETLHAMSLSTPTRSWVSVGEGTRIADGRLHIGIPNS